MLASICLALAKLNLDINKEIAMKDTLVELSQKSIDDAEFTLEINELGSVSADTQKRYAGFEQDDPFLYWG